MVFGLFGLLLGALCILWVLALLVIITLYVQGLGFKYVPPTGHALRAEVGGAIIFVTPGKFAGQHKKTASQIFCGYALWFLLVSSCIC